jgi:polysaccharide export outer membrane protein
MKVLKHLQSIILLAIIGLVFSTAVQSQTDDRKAPNKEREKIAKAEKDSNSKDLPDDGQSVDEDDETKEAKKTVDYYNNYLQEYRLGPNDIISIEVFGQCPDYCKTDVNVPPTARMSYPLIREGVFVGGKTVEEVAADVTKKLEEYIIDPKVTVSLVRPGSARYAVMGKVAQPGVRIMDRRISINEAILDAGGIAKGGSKKKVYIARVNPQGFYSQEAVDLIAIETGKAPTIFLKPGDQVYIGEKGFTLSKFFDYLGKASAARILFGSPF